MGNNGMILVSRITSTTFFNCKKNLNIITNENIDKYFSIFGDYKNSASGILKYNLKNYKYEIINPFYNSKNVGQYQYQGFEDPRVFKFQNKLWIITYFRGINEINNKFEHSIFIFSLENPQNYLKLNYKKQNQDINILGKWGIGGEKNWMPFEFNNELYIVYSIFPHIILKVNLTTGECIELYKTKYKTEFIFRGGVGNGAPPQLFIQNNKKYFLGLGHTKNNYNGISSQIRKNFFYIFDSTPPFEILRVSPEFNISKKFAPIEYGSGLLINSENNLVTISFGVNDCYENIVQTPLQNILNFIKFKDIKDNWLYDYFDEINVIYIPKRLEYCKKIFKKLRVDPKFVSGILKDTIAPTKELSNGKLACYLSHVNILREFLNSNNNTCLIFEDDIKPNNSIHDLDLILKDSFLNIPVNWDVLYLGRCCDSCTRDKKISNYLVKNNNPSCTHAIAFSKKGVRKFYENSGFIPKNKPIDWVIKDLIKSGKLNSYSIKPSLFQQNRENFISEIDTQTNIITDCSNFNIIYYILCPILIIIIIFLILTKISKFSKLI